MGKPDFGTQSVTQEKHGKGIKQKRFFLSVSASIFTGVPRQARFRVLANLR